MRLSRILASFLFVALTLIAMAASADAPHKPTALTCPKTFSCSDMPIDELFTMANDCAVQASGSGVHQEGLFDGTTPDSNNCMVGEALQVSGGQRLVPRCCAVNNGNNCGMRCQLLH